MEPRVTYLRWLIQQTVHSPNNWRRSYSCRLINHNPFHQQLKYLNPSQSSYAEWAIHELHWFPQFRCTTYIIKSSVSWLRRYFVFWNWKKAIVWKGQRETAHVRLLYRFSQKLLVIFIPVIKGGNLCYEDSWSFHGLDWPGLAVLQFVQRLWQHLQAAPFIKNLSIIMKLCLPFPFKHTITPVFHVICRLLKKETVIRHFDACEKLIDALFKVDRNS